MLLSNRPRIHYANAPVHEVVCQLRFPTILSVNKAEPADFQEAIRSEFPQYVRREEMVPPRISGLGGPNPSVEQKPPVANYYFFSADGHWKLNLTQHFIALSTLRYPGWEAFALRLDKPLASFIQVYQPAYFERVGLRYMNLFSRAKLGLDGAGWGTLFTPAYASPLREEDVREEDCLHCGCDLTLKLGSSCQVKIHAGPGRIKSAAPNIPPDPEVKFILDLDLSMGGNVPCTLAAGALETLHGYGTRVFEGAVTDTLRDAMRPAP